MSASITRRDLQLNSSTGHWQPNTSCPSSYRLVNEADWSTVFRAADIFIIFGVAQSLL